MGAVWRRGITKSKALEKSISKKNNTTTFKQHVQRACFQIQESNTHLGLVALLAHLRFGLL